MRGHAVSVSQDNLIISHCASWLWLANELIENPEFKPNGKYIKELTGQNKMGLPRLSVIN
jgi:hypothetical protein